MTQSTRTPAPTCRGLHSAETSVSSEQVDIYGAPFWSAYAANFLVSIGVAILIRYGDFITLLGGTELHLGWIVGIGMVGSMAMRLAMGAGIDSYGPRLVWLGSVALFVVMCLAHLAITSPTGMPIYLLRVGYCCAIAGIYGASMTFVSSRTPMTRIAEIVGMLGTAGFIGNMVGTQLGDHLRNSGPMDRWQMDQMFLVAAMFGLCSMPVSWLAMRGRSHPAPATHQPMFRLLRKYHPGMLLLVVVAMGSALNLPFTFLPTYAAELGIPRIALFFTVYSIAAVLTRIATRRWPERLGLRTMILLGSTGMAISQALFLVATSEWLLVLPGIGYGMSHAVLFPATVAMGTQCFPSQHRGLATTLILAMWDAGQVIGMPAAGAIVHYSAMIGLPPYPTMFLSMASVVAVAGVSYACFSRAPGQRMEPESEMAPSHRARRRRKHAVRV